MSYHIIRSELSASAEGGWSFLKALISVMLARQNWIIDAERYRIPLSLHLPAALISIYFPPTRSLSLTPAFKLKCHYWIYFHFSPHSLFFFGWFVSILVFSFFKRFVSHTHTAYFVTHILHRHSLLNCSFIKCCTRRLQQKRQEWKRKQRNPAPFCSYGTFGRIFHCSLQGRQSAWKLSFKEKMVTTLKEITELERF